MNYLAAGSALFLSIILCGCTHVQLRKSTAKQLRTNTDIMQQQVMDNLARISADPNGWPEFTNFADGLTQINDTGEGNVGLRWNARTITEEMLGLRGTRQVQEKWGLKPVTDPARLRAMWAVYHYTLYGNVPEDAYYSGSLHLSQVLGKGWQELLPPPGWIKVSCDNKPECAEKFSCGCIVGHYCDTQTCVLPGHRAELQQLTFLIMYISGVNYYEGATQLSFPTGAPQIPWKGPKAANEINQPGFEGRSEEGGVRTGPASNFNVFPTFPGFGSP